MTRLSSPDWSHLPPPEDDGAAAHLIGTRLPGARLASTDGGEADLSALPGLSVVYAYPMTGRPDRALPEGWDMIPGARGCTPQSCAFRDHFADLRGLGVRSLFGLSTQATADQAEVVERLHLPFPLLSDHALSLVRALNLPTLKVDGMTLLKRLTWIAKDGMILKVFYPVFPPDRSAVDVLAWLRSEGARS